MSEDVYTAREILRDLLFVLRAPARRLRREPVERKVDGEQLEAHVHPAAAVKTQLGVQGVEVEQRACHHDALVFVERLVKLGKRKAGAVEHQIPSHQAAGVRKAVGEAAGLRQQQQ